MTILNHFNHLQLLSGNDDFCTEFEEKRLKVMTESLNPNNENYYNYGIEERVINKILPRLLVNRIGRTNIANSIQFVNENGDRIACKTIVSKNLGPEHDCPYHDVRLTENEVEYVSRWVANELLYEKDADFVNQIKSVAETKEVNERKLAKTIIKTAEQLVRVNNGHNSNIVIIMSPIAYRIAADDLKEKYPNINIVWNTAEMEKITAVVCYIDNEKSGVSYYPYYFYLEDMVTSMFGIEPKLKVKATHKEALVINKPEWFKVIEVKPKLNIFKKIKDILYNFFTEE